MMEYCVQDAEMSIQEHKGNTSLTHILSGLGVIMLNCSCSNLLLSNKKVKQNAEVAGEFLSHFWRWSQSCLAKGGRQQFQA